MTWRCSAQWRSEGGGGEGGVAPGGTFFGGAAFSVGAALWVSNTS